MLVVARKASLPDHSFSALDTALIKAWAVWPDVKDRLHCYENSMTEPSSPRTSQAKADNEFLRGKLRDSLTSALEMVVSKQLVKNVLGKATEADLVEDRLPSLCKTEGHLRVGMSTEGTTAAKLPHRTVQRLDHLSGSNQPVNMNVDGGSGLKVDDTHGRLLMISTAEQSGCYDRHSEVDEPATEDFEKEATVDVVEEAKGGIQLMEQARKVAWNVELNLFSFNGGVNKKYKEKARSLLFNLKDKSNPELRARVFKGDILPEILVSMSAAELASKELCRWRIAKAKEFASMVVLTEADMDPRPIVKKTHKGEFHVVVEGIGISAGAESSAARPALRANNVVRTEGNEDGVLFGSLGAFSDTSSLEGGEVDRRALSQIPVLHGTVEDESIEVPANDLVNDPPPITSREEDTEWHGESEIKESSRSNGSGQYGEMKTVPSLHSDSSGDEMWTSVQPPSSDAGTLKVWRSPITSISEPESANAICLCTERHSGSPVWEGSLQLSATRCVSIGGFYKSGARLELKDWPESVEVKGRVKLGVLDKFLRDLQLSRSRTVTGRMFDYEVSRQEWILTSRKTANWWVNPAEIDAMKGKSNTMVTSLIDYDRRQVLSLCPSHGQGVVKQMGAYLKEIADHYRMGDRAGFAEPRPGFELYLLAPGSACLDILLEGQRSLERAFEERDEVLVGVVVWRRLLSQGFPSSQGPKHSCISRKVALANLVCHSRTAGHAQPQQGKETPIPRRGSSTSLKRVSDLSLVSGSGNTPMHSTQFGNGSWDTRDPDFPKHYEHLSPAVGLHCSPSVFPLNRGAENAHRATDSRLLPLLSCVYEDLPPGFRPQSKPSVSQARPVVLSVQTKQHVQDCQGSRSHAGSVPTPRTQDRNREVFTEAFPRFWPTSLAKFPTDASQRVHTGVQRDDDDLPEFNFDTEGEAQWNPVGHGIEASKPVCLSGYDSGVREHVTGLQHIVNRTTPESHHNTNVQQPSSAEFPSVSNRLPLRHLSQQGGSSAPRSGSLIPSSGWNNAVFATEIVHTVTQSNSKSVIALGSPDHRNLPRLATQDPTTCEKLLGDGDLLSRVSERTTTAPSGFASCGATVVNGVDHTTVCNGFLPRDGLPPIIRQVRRPGLSPTFMSYCHHNSRQPPLLNMVVEHQQIEMRSSFLCSGGELPRPHQEVRPHEWPAIGSNDPSKMSPLNSDQVYSKRKIEPMERNFDKVRVSEDSVHDVSHDRAEPRSSDFSFDPSFDSITESGPKRWGRGNVCAAGGRILVSDVGGDTDELCMAELRKRVLEWDP